MESDIRSIRLRNAKVEADKAWEISMFRVVTIAAVTYTVATAFLWINGVSSPFMNALVPTIGYVLSTRSLPAIKRWWIAWR